MFFRILYTTIFAIYLLSSCNQSSNKKEKFLSPKGYELNKPLIVKLPVELDEISGIVYYEKDDGVFAISDDRGSIFKINSSKDVSKWKFSHGGDFEDLALVDSSFFVLQSNGDVYKVVFENDSTLTETYKFDLAKKNEFESMYYDKQTNKLVLICKDCKSDDKKSLTTFSFDLATHTFSESSLLFQMKTVADMVKGKLKQIKPSAAALNPVNGMLYIVSSVNKILMVATPNGDIKEAYQLNPKYFKQPEGLTFKTNGDMIISNEFADTETATLLVFKYNSAN